MPQPMPKSQPQPQSRPTRRSPLTDTQLVILSAAAQRESGGIVVPDRLVGQSRQIVLARLSALGLIEPAAPPSVAADCGQDAADTDREYGREHAHHAITALSLGEPRCEWRISKAGLEAIGIETEIADNGDQEHHQNDREGGGGSQSCRSEATPPSAAHGSPDTAAPGGGSTLPGDLQPSRSPSVSHASKLALVVDLLGRPEGASVEEIAAATGWQRHSVRGCIAGSVKRKLGLTVLIEVRESVRTYRVER